MNTYLQYFVILGVLVQIIGITKYIRETIRGNTKPNRISWLLWSIAPIIGAIATLSKGFTLAALPVFMSGFGPFLVFISSFINKNSYWKLGKFDYICGVFSILALVLWYITKEANVAILLAILSDGAASIPTLVKAWHHPETETAAPFMAGLFSNLTSSLAIRSWTFTEIAFPSYLITFNVILISLIKRKRKKLVPGIVKP